jgi:glycosyltransferase involved in cell wall biosynthesis
MHKSLRNNAAFVDSTIRILLREVATSENLKIKENLSAEICKMLMINELEGLRYFELFKNRYQRINTTDPVISVLITSYNTAEFILPCITTILLQTYQNIEVIIIDDGSTDKTLEILETIKDSRLKVFAFSKNKGRAEALNYGLSLCTGQYLALMDSDDLASPLRIEKLYEHLQKNQLDAVSSQLYEYKNNSDYTISSFRTDEKAIKVTMLFYNAVPHAATLFKLETVKAISYREGFDYAEDYDMLARYSLHYKLGMVNEPLYLYRRRVNSATGITNHEKAELSQKKIVNDLFDHALFNITKPELDIHFYMLRSIKNPIMTQSKELIRIKSWIYKMIKKNKLRKFFDEKSLKRILLNNYWSVFYYANIKNHNIKTAVNMFTLEDIKLSFLIMKEGLKADLKKLIGKNTQ